VFVKLTRDESVPTLGGEPPKPPFWGEKLGRLP